MNECIFRQNVFGMSHCTLRGNYTLIRPEAVFLTPSEVKPCESKTYFPQNHKVTFRKDDVDNMNYVTIKTVISQVNFLQHDDLLLRFGIIWYNSQGQRLEGALRPGTDYLQYVGFEILTTVVVKISVI